MFQRCCSRGTYKQCLRPDVQDLNPDPRFTYIACLVIWRTHPQMRTTLHPAPQMSGAFLSCPPTASRAAAAKAWKPQRYTSQNPDEKGRVAGVARRLY